MANPIVQQIKIGSTVFDIDAIKFAGKTEDEWKQLIDTLGFDVYITTTGNLPTPNATNYATYKNTILLHSASGNPPFTESLMIRRGSAGSYTYAYEDIGVVDMSAYALKTEAGKAGVYTTSSPSSASSGSAGAGTYTTTSAGAQTASGTATVTIPMPVYTGTGSSGGTGTSANTGNAGGFTINGSNFTVSGAGHSHDVDTRSLYGELDDHSYQPSGTISGSQSVSNHTHGVSTNTTDVWQPTTTATVLKAATVSNGVLSFTSDIAAGATGTATTVLTSVSVNGGGSHTVSGSNFSFTGITATISHSAVTMRGTVTTYDTTPNITIGGSQSVAAHSHSYTAPAAHSHTLTTGSPTNVTVTGTAAVAVSSHTHSVTISNHTHSISHTHALTVPAIA